MCILPGSFVNKQYGMSSNYHEEYIALLSNLLVDG